MVRAVRKASSSSWRTSISAFNAAIDGFTSLIIRSFFVIASAPHDVSELQAQVIRWRALRFARQSEQFVAEAARAAHGDGHRLRFRHEAGKCRRLSTRLTRATGSALLRLCGCLPVAAQPTARVRRSPTWTHRPLFPVEVSRGTFRAVMDTVPPCAQDVARRVIEAGIKPIVASATTPTRRQPGPSIAI